MKGPVFIFGGLATCLVFLAATYALSGSFWTSLAATAAVVVLLQLGYVAYVVLLVAGEKRRRAADAEVRSEADFPGEAEAWRGEMGLGSDKPVSRP